ncbi:MAG: amidohydrolase [Crocinitomicaceae bacterium]|nr:amidohydrolase [Crocinitomicaceae bacterium]
MNTDDFIEMRRYLHQHPEVSENEVSTSNYIRERMKEIWPDAELEVVQENGLIYSQENGEAKCHVAFRCELDALPIQEVNDFEYRSVNDGVGHKCGHDGHMAIVLRLADRLKQQFPENCRVTLIFQPAEENGVGAKAMLEHSKFLKANQPDYYFALHNVPGFPESSVVVKYDEFTPAVISVKTYLHGKTSHAAEPENGINPAYTIAELLPEVRDQANFDRTSEDMVVVAAVEVQVGKHSYGTSAGEGMLGLTFRAWSQERLEYFKGWFEAHVEAKCEKAGINCEFEWFDEFQSIVNDLSATDAVRSAAEKLNYDLIAKNEPFSWGEDYGLFTQSAKGVMFGLGAGVDTPALHNPDYDFPDNLIETGSELFYTILTEIIHD